MLDRLHPAQPEIELDDPISAVAAAIVESHLQIGRARHMIAVTRRLRVQTEAAIAASRQVLGEANRILAR